MITLKLKIQNEIHIEEYQRQFSCLVRYSYNGLLKNVDITHIKNLCKSLNNIDLDASFIEYATTKASYILKSQQERKQKTVIFGGKQNFIKLSKHKITKEAYKKNRLLPMFSVGKLGDYLGNRKFELDTKNNKVIFKPNRKTHIDVILPRLSKNQRTLLEKIEILAKNHKAPITYELTNDYIYIIFDECYCSEPYQNFKPGRILSIDSNPNFLGITVCDYINGKQKIIHKEIISNKLINDINTKGLNSSHFKNIYKASKRNYEVCEVAKYISKLAHSKHCEYVAIEKLNVLSKDDKRGRNYNKLLNNMWNRNKLFSNIKKWCNLKSIKINEVPPQYSSFIGCLNNPLDYDSVAASLEINRRASAYISTFITKTHIQTNHIIYPKINKKLFLNKWKDEGLTDKDLFSWVTLYDWFKKSKSSYRLLFDIDKNMSQSLRLFSPKSKLLKFELGGIINFDMIDPI